MNRLAQLCAQWNARVEGEIGRTAAAAVFEVTPPDGPAVLKLYLRGDAGNEAAGAALMRAWAGSGAMVGVLARAPDAVLLDRLDGPSLGDLARAGDGDRACRLLAQTAQRLHGQPPPPTPGLMPLDTVFAALFELRPGSACPDALRDAMGQAQALTRALLAEPADGHVALHGDLHHDNVILTATGPVAFDAKGMRGDLGYDLANALRHPRGIPVDDPARIAHRLTLFAAALGLSRAHLARWAVAKCALSIAWRAKGVLGADPEESLLVRLLDAAGSSSGTDGYP